VKSDVHMADEIKRCESVSSLRQTLTGDIDPATLGRRERRAIVQKLDEMPEFGIPVRVALVGSDTLDPLAEQLRPVAACLGLRTETYVAPYGQYMQEILQAGESGLTQFAPDTVLLALSLESLSSDITESFATTDDAIRDKAINKLVGDILSWCRAAEERTNATILVANFSPIHRSAWGLADVVRAESETEFYQRLNRRLKKTLQSLSRSYVLDLAGLIATFGLRNAWSARNRYLAKQPWSAKFLGEYAFFLGRHLFAAKSLAKKCLVLDLDNTLWGGVVGEDGVSGIHIGFGDPIGEAFLSFQFGLKNLRDLGVILAICSKNNLTDVEELFIERDEMLLHLDDFVAFEINWNSKPENLVRLSRKLNIGLDSIVFLDDNPAEIAQVRGALPDVTALVLPRDPAEYRAFLDRLPFFERLSVSEEDRRKSEQYAENNRRSEDLKEFNNLDDYLADLGTWLELWEARPDNITRVHQLFAKTNQFNVTTRRYSLADVERFVKSDDHILIVANAGDKFGELGLIGICLLIIRDSSVSIDSWLLSCRALGRAIETAFMNVVKERYFSELSLRVTATFLPTAKNVPAADFFDKQRFERESEPTASGEAVNYKLVDRNVLSCPHVRVFWKEDCNGRDTLHAGG